MNKVKDFTFSHRSKRAKDVLSVDLNELDEITDKYLNISMRNMELRSQKSKKVVYPRKLYSSVRHDKPRLFSFNHIFSVRKKTPILDKIRKYERYKKALSILPYRVGAFFIDIAIIHIPILFYLYYNAIENGYSFKNLVFSPISFFIPVLLLFYFIFTEGFGGQSIGKIFMNIGVVENNNYRKPIGLRLAILRIFYFLMGALFFGLGIFSALRDGSFRAWHDRMTRSLVCRQKNE